MQVAQVEVICQTHAWVQGEMSPIFLYHGRKSSKHISKMVEGVMNPDGVKIWLASFKWLSKATPGMTHN